MFLRMEQWTALPRDGGIEVQDAWTMAAGDVLSPEFWKIKRALQEEEDFMRGRG